VAALPERLDQQRPDAVVVLDDQELRHAETVPAAPAASYRCAHAFAGP
jgi:hypothetical protein